MPSRVFILMMLLLSSMHPTAFSDTRPPYDFYVPPPQVWVTFSLGQPSGAVTQKQIAGSIGVLVDRLDYDYKQYVEAYRNWMVGTMDVRLTVDEDGTISGTDVLASDLNRQLEVMVTSDLEGYKLANSVGKSFIVKLSLRFAAEEPIIRDTDPQPCE
jgi:hypothetical protein